MKKLLYTFLVLCGFCLSASAQNSSRQINVSTNNHVVSSNEKLIAVQGCAELDNQLAVKFGKSYTITDPNVVAQLQKNIADANLPKEIRKASLFAIYGDDYVNKLHLITNNVNQISTQNK